MRELKKEFIGRGQVKGFRFTQIKQNQYGFLYQISDDINTWYEVFHKKENSRYNCMSYPSNKAFGVWAWTYHTLCKAESKFTEITEDGFLRAERGVING